MKHRLISVNDSDQGLSGKWGTQDVLKNAKGFSRFQKKQPDARFLENKKRKQLFSIRFACCVSATAAKPCIIAAHPQLWCDHRSLRGSNRRFRPLYVCRCLPWFLHGEKTRLLGLSEEALSLKLKLSRSLRLRCWRAASSSGLLPHVRQICLRCGVSHLKPEFQQVFQTITPLNCTSNVLLTL